MVMCKQSIGKEDPIIHTVTSAPEPKYVCHVYITDFQLTNIERFCSSTDGFCLLSVDPTFNLGDFYVTVTNFCNLLLKNQTTGKNPVMIRHMLVHQCQLVSSYRFCASSPVSRKPCLSCLKAHGTDGKECLYSAFHKQFCRHII